MTLASLRRALPGALPGALALALALVAPAASLGAQGAHGAQGTVSAPADTATPVSVMDGFIRATRALGAGDHAGVKRILRATRAFAPDVPAVLYHLARAEALTGEPAAALATLAPLAAQGVARDLLADSAFAGLRNGPDSARFRALAARLAQAAAPVIRSDTAFTLADPDFIPEGIAYDAAQDAFFVGSLRRGGVLRVARDGSVRPFLVATPTALAEVLGLHVDARRGWLWVASFVSDSAAPRHRDGGGGWAELRAHDLRTGALVARHPAPDRARPQLLNDVAVAPNGDVYVTDSEGGALWRLPSGGAGLVRVHGGALDFTYPNGVAASRDGRTLYVAHIEGISAFGLGGARPAAPVRLALPPGVTGGGIDGLYTCGDGLLAVQRLFDFQQVTRFVLAPGGRRVARVEALERRHPAYDVATTGAIAGDTFAYIASAQLGRLRPRGALAPAASPTKSVVLRLPMAPGCHAAR